MIRHSIVLAAGGGRRFGGSKLTAILNGRPLLHHVLDAAVHAPAHEVTVVTGAHADAIADSVADYRRAHPDARPITVVHCPAHDEGMAASLRCGLANVPPSADAAFVFLGDMPSIPPSLATVLAEHLTGDRLAVAPVNAGRRGHPVPIRRPLFAIFDGLTGDKGGSTRLDDLGDTLARLEAEPGVLADVDRRDDLARHSHSIVPGGFDV